jgi:CheY-like chemotaxis protein
LKYRESPSSPSVSSSSSSSSSSSNSLVSHHPSSFTLILMDVEMPVMNGIEATKAIRAHEVDLGLSRIPIVGISAYTRVEYINIALASGMDSYFTKPFEHQTIMQTIHDWANKTARNN